MVKFWWSVLNVYELDAEDHNTNNYVGIIRYITKADGLRPALQGRVKYYKTKDDLNVIT